MIFEYLQYDLRKLLMMRRLSEAECLDFLQQILTGLLVCHSNRIIHRDLKPQNILIDKDGNLKIADFGLARSFSVPFPELTHEVVTLWYRSPEILLGQTKYTPSVDIWSIGCIYGEMLRGQPMFEGDSEIGQIYKIFQALGTPSEATWPGLSSLPDYSPRLPHQLPPLSAEPDLATGPRRRPAPLRAAPEDAHFGPEGAAFELRDAQVGGLTRSCSGRPSTETGATGFCRSRQTLFEVGAGRSRLPAQQ